jgi:hypothetical protein
MEIDDLLTEENAKPGLLREERTIFQSSKSAETTAY